MHDAVGKDGSAGGPQRLVVAAIEVFLGEDAPIKEQDGDFDRYYGRIVENFGNDNLMQLVEAPLYQCISWIYLAKGLRVFEQYCMTA